MKSVALVVFLLGFAFAGLTLYASIECFLELYTRRTDGQTLRQRRFELVNSGRYRKLFRIALLGVGGFALTTELAIWLAR